MARASGSVIEMVNSARAEHGLGSLAYNGTLTTIAEEHSAAMRDAGTIFHNSNLGGEVSSNGLTWRVLGENVGVGADVEHVEQAFMESAEHHQNITDDRFNAIGIGVQQDSSGHVYVTQVFAQLEVATPPPVTRPPPTVAVVSVPAPDPAPAPAAARPTQNVAAETPTTSDPPGFMRAEDESLVPISYYAQQICSSQGWIGSMFAVKPSLTTSLFADPC
jgi:hypothetical protein